MVRALLVFAALLLGAPAMAQANEYAVGQVWEYRTGPQDKGSLIKIQQIEINGLEGGRTEIFHISMINIHGGDGVLISAIQHLPVSRQTLDASVTTLSASNASFPDHRDGVAAWREAEGGVFTITLAQISDVLRQSIAQGRGQ